MANCLAVDIGASSGRVILGVLENGILKLTEIHRFENKIVKKGEVYCWEAERLFQEIITGLKICGKKKINPKSIGIDTWAVDFMLLDENNQPLTEAVSYRDPRTDGVMEEVFKLCPKEKLYSETGIQFQKFNTIYQLYSIKSILEKAKSFLMLPDYFHFLLTGKKGNEYTNATSTQLVNVHSKNWDYEIIGLLGLNKEIFQEIRKPGSVLGNLSLEIVSQIGFDMKVILPATHDTGSAVLAVTEEDAIYISSGTWSLIGVELDHPIYSEKAMECNFTNEGGMDGRYRFLKNCMGLWILEEVKRNYEYTYNELIELAKEAVDYKGIIDVNDNRFLNPENMVNEINNYCLETQQPVPLTPGEIAKCVFDSLAESYRSAVAEIEDILGETFEKVNVIGGGCKNEFLNQLIANVTNKEVYAGPAEATAVGNLTSQFIALGEIKDKKEAREIIKKSFEVKKYLPANIVTN